MFYLLAVVINAANLDPIVIKDCIEVNAETMKDMAKKASSDIEKLGLTCEKNPESVVYNCVSKEKKLIGKVVVMKDKAECKAFPNKMSNDMKNLLNRN